MAVNNIYTEADPVPAVNTRSLQNVPRPRCWRWKPTGQGPSLKLFLSGCHDAKLLASRGHCRDTEEDGRPSRLRRLFRPLFGDPIGRSGKVGSPPPSSTRSVFYSVPSVHQCMASLRQRRPCPSLLATGSLTWTPEQPAELQSEAGLSLP